MPTWLKYVLEILPVFSEWLKWVIEMPDTEFENISTAWPAPTKTRLAKLRYDAKLEQKFGGQP